MGPAMGGDGTVDVLVFGNFKKKKKKAEYTKKKKTHIFNFFSVVAHLNTVK